MDCVLDLNALIIYVLLYLSPSLLTCLWICGFGFGFTIIFNVLFFVPGAKTELPR